MAEPPFVPKPGQVDYTNVRYAPVVNTVITCKGKVLLVQRSPDLRLYPGYWSGVSGFLDDNRSIEEKVVEELLEELAMPASAIGTLERGTVLLQESPLYHKTWLVVPVLVHVTKMDVTLDWEAAQAEWYTMQDALALELLPGFAEVLEQFRDRV